MAQDNNAAAQNCWVNTNSSKDSKVLDLVKTLITKQIYCTLSTYSSDGNPWGTPLLFVADNDLNIYWSSAIASQHSQNIYSNQGKVTITIYDAEKIKAVYLSGTASELTEPSKLTEILRLFDKRAKRPTARIIDDYLDKSLRRMYKFSTEKVWVTGDRLEVNGQLIDTKNVVDLSQLRSHK